MDTQENPSFVQAGQKIRIQTAEGWKRMQEKKRRALHSVPVKKTNSVKKAKKIAINE